MIAPIAVSTASDAAQLLVDDLQWVTTEHGYSPEAYAAINRAKAALLAYITELEAEVERLRREVEPSPTWPCPRCEIERGIFPACFDDHCPFLDGDGRTVEPIWRTVAEP